MIPTNIYNSMEALVDSYRGVEEFTLKRYPGTKTCYTLFITANNKVIRYDWTINGFKWTSTEELEIK